MTPDEAVEIVLSRPQFAGFATTLRPELLKELSTTATQPEASNAHDQ